MNENRVRITNPQSKNLYWFKALISFLMLLAVTDLQTIAAITPQIAQGLTTTTTAISYSFVSYSLSAVFAALLLRTYAKKLGNTRLLSFAAILYALSCLLVATAPNIFIFIAARSLSGIAGGFISALAITALANVTSYKKRGVNMSLISFSYYMAPMFGVPLSTFLTASYGWRTVFFVTGALVFVTGILIQFSSLTSQSETSEQSDFKSEHTNLSLSLRMGIVSAFFVSGSIVGFTTFLGTWLFDSLKANPKQVGFAYALINCGALIGGISGGFLADKIGKRTIALHPNLIMTFCLLSLPLFIWESARIALIIMIAFAAALRVAPLQALLTELASPKEIASYIATRNVASQLGIGVSILICGQLYFNYGLNGVSVACAVLTICAWITIRAITEPLITQIKTSETISPNALYD